MAKRFLTVIMLMTSLLTAAAQGDTGARHFITPNSMFGLGFNADTNHPTFSGSLRLMMQVGNAEDWLNLNMGIGYRGFFDRRPPVEFLRHPSFSDYMLYSRDNGETKDVRPMGGQLIVPIEAQLNLLEIDDFVFFYVGCGLEFGQRIYQSKRYGECYGSHVMNGNSLNIYPSIGVQIGEDDEIGLNISLYWRHYMKRATNGEDLPIDKFDAKNYFGFQIYIVI